MVLLARKIEGDSLWAEADDFWKDGDFPYFLLSEFADARQGKGQGMSVFEVSSRTDPKLRAVAASLFLGGGQSSAPRACQFRFVETADLDRIGIVYSQTRSNTPFQELSSAHYDLANVDGKKAVELLRILADQQPEVVVPSDLVSEIVDGIVRARFLHKTLNKEGLNHLRRQGQVLFSGVALEGP